MAFSCLLSAVVHIPAFSVGRPTSREPLRSMKGSLSSCPPPVSCRAPPRCRRRGGICCHLSLRPRLPTLPFEKTAARFAFLLLAFRRYTVDISSCFLTDGQACRAIYSLKFNPITFSSNLHCEKDWITLDNLRKKVGGFVTF